MRTAKNKSEFLNLHFYRTQSNELEHSNSWKNQKKTSGLSRNWDRHKLRIWGSIFPLLRVSLPFGPFCFWSWCASHVFSSFIVVMNPGLWVLFSRLLYLPPGVRRPRVPLSLLGPKGGAVPGNIVYNVQHPKTGETLAGNFAKKPRLLTHCRLGTKE